MADVKALAEELVNLTVKDVQELANILKEEYEEEYAYYEEHYTDVQQGIYEPLWKQKNIK